MISEIFMANKHEKLIEEIGG
ncbi:MAG: hypothetical protein ACD_5C00062G0002, partial [uncultured bacterium]